MMPTERSAVLVGPRRMEMREFPVPRAGEDDGVLEVEVAGVCGERRRPLQRRQRAGDPWGTRSWGASRTSARWAQQAWGVGSGDRVVVEADVRVRQVRAVPDWAGTGCATCRGRYGGAVRADVAPHLWGGYGQVVYLPPTARVHRISEELPGDVAVLVCAVLGNGVRWLRTVGGRDDRRHGGSRGARAAGGWRPRSRPGSRCAREVVVVGLSRDEARLSMARRLGATQVIATDRGRPAGPWWAELTDGAMANVVIGRDEHGGLAAAGAGPGRDGRGRWCCGGGAGQRPSPLMTDRITAEEITIRGVNTHDSPAVKQALSIAESGRYPAGRGGVAPGLPWRRRKSAIRTVAGEIPADGFIKAVLYPDS